jgi:hypothetical protein
MNIKVPNICVIRKMAVATPSLLVRVKSDITKSVQSPKESMN